MTYKNWGEAEASNWSITETFFSGKFKTGLALDIFSSKILFPKNFVTFKVTFSCPQSICSFYFYLNITDTYWPLTGRLVWVSKTACEAAFLGKKKKDSENATGIA